MNVTRVKKKVVFFFENLFKCTNHKICNRLYPESDIKCDRLNLKTRKHISKNTRAVLYNALVCLKILCNV